MGVSQTQAAKSCKCTLAAARLPFFQPLSLKAVFANFDENAEISCEIDPRFLDETQTKVLTQNGFNRISFGVQDFDEKVQKEIHRIQPFELTKSALDMVRKQ